jgi:hypothetical protein
MGSGLRVAVRLNKWPTQLHTQSDRMYVPAAANNVGAPCGKKTGKGWCNYLPSQSYKEYNSKHKSKNLSLTKFIDMSINIYVSK